MWPSKFLKKGSVSICFPDAEAKKKQTNYFDNWPSIFALCNDSGLIKMHEIKHFFLE